MLTQTQALETLVSRLHIRRSSAQQFLGGAAITNPTDRVLLDALARSLTGRAYAHTDIVQMTKLREAMQRENLVFTSVSNVLKLRHDSGKNSIANVR